MSGRILFQSQTSRDASKEDKAIPVYGKKPPRPPRSGTKSKVLPGPEDFPRALSLNLPPDEANKGASDLARFLCEVKLPQRITIKESCVVPGCSTALNEGDNLLLHFIYDNPTVHAATSKGKNLRLPIYAKQEYEILPLDPRLDDIVYDGTKELVEASPLPSTVRVVEAFYAEEDEEYQVVGDIIEIKGVEHDKDRGKILVGKCGSAPIKYSTEMNSTFTTMLFPDFYRIYELKDFNFPQRIRITGDMDDPLQRTLTQKQVLHLKKFSVDKCVVATRAGHPHIYTIPVVTPMKFSQDPMTLPEKRVLGMLPALYPLVNTSWGLVDPTQEVLPPSMRAIPQPLEQVLEAWLPSAKGKLFSPTEESALEENINTRRTTHDLPVVPPHSDKPRYHSEGGPRLPPRSPRDRMSISSDPGSSFTLDSDSDSDMYESVSAPVNPLPKGISKQVMAAVRDILTKKEMELRKERGSMNLWKAKCKTLENEVMKLKETVASALRQELPQPRGPLHEYDDDDDDDYDGYAYLKPIPEDWTLPRASAHEGQKPSAASPSPQKTGNLKEFTIAEVGEFLRQHALEKYVDTFRKNGVNGALLVEMEEVHMLDLQMSRFHALKLKIEVGKRCTPPLPL